MEQKEKHSGYGFGMCGEGRGHGWCRAVKVLVWLAILVTVFALGMLGGAVRTARYYGAFPSGMMGWRSNAMGEYGRSWMMGGYSNDAKNLQKVFGMITSIEGNMITISDNGGKLIPVLSTSDTTILEGQNEISLSALTAGQDVSVLGTLDANNQIEAKYIYTQGL